MSTFIAKLKIKLATETILTLFAITLVSIFILLNFYIPFNLLLFIVCLGAAGVLILRAPEAGIYTIIFCTIIFERWFTLQPIEWSGGILKLYPLDIIILFTILAFFVYWATHRRKTKIIWRDKKFGWALWLLVIFISLHFIRTVMQGQADLALAFSTFKNFVLYFIVYLLTINIIRRPEQFRRLINTFILAGVFLVYFIIYGFLTGQGIWAEYVPLSTRGIRLLGGPHSFYITALIIFLGNILVWRKKWQGQYYFYLILILVFILGLVGSLQRHLWLALILAVAMLLYWYPSKQRRKFVHLFSIGLVVLMIVVLSSFWFYSWQTSNFLIDADIVESSKFRLFSFFTAGSIDSSAIWRLASWNQAREVFSDNWLNGVGLGQKLNFEIGELEFNVEMRELHNDFIGLAVQTGILGILVSFYLVLGIIRRFWRGYQKLKAEYQPYFLTFFTLAIIFLWSANFGTYFDINLLVIFFWIFLGGMSVAGELGE